MCRRQIRLPCGRYELGNRASEGFNMNCLHCPSIADHWIIDGSSLYQRSRSSGEEDVWNVDTLPAMDQTANSMYGGAQEIFHQPVAQQPVAQIQPLLKHSQLRTHNQLSLRLPSLNMLLQSSLKDHHYLQQDFHQVGAWNNGLTMGSNTSILCNKILDFTFKMYC